MHQNLERLSLTQIKNWILYLHLVIWGDNIDDTISLLRRDSSQCSGMAAGHWGGEGWEFYWEVCNGQELIKTISHDHPPTYWEIMNQRKICIYSICIPHVCMACIASVICLFNFNMTNWYQSSIPSPKHVNKTCLEITSGCENITKGLLILCNNVQTTR